MTQLNSENSISIFEMTGKDVLTFLKNQVISDLNHSQDFPIFTAICNPKGRILFTLILQRNESRTLIAVDASLSDNFLQYINMRKFRMDLTIKKSSQQLLMTNPTGPSNVKDHFAFKTVNGTAITAVQNFWLIMFNSGLPWVTHKTTEQFIPQHVNLDELGVIAFDKGCYPGQEIVARLHFLGRIKKRMKYFELPSDQETCTEERLKMLTAEQELTLCSPIIYHDNACHFQAITTLDSD